MLLLTNYFDGCENGDCCSRAKSFVQQLQIRQGRTKQIEKDIRGTKLRISRFLVTNMDKDSNQTIYEEKIGLSPIEGFPFGSGNTINYGSEQYVTIMDPDWNDNIKATVIVEENDGLTRQPECCSDANFTIQQPIW